jgi:methylated-DNA-[protein]-cysteine S-methyltransferase
MLEWRRLQTDGLACRVVASENGIRAIDFEPAAAMEGGESLSNPLLREAVEQLQAYMARQLRDFDLPLDMVGTEFQKRVWNALLDIPYGETRSYSFVAQSIGSPKAVRAVGAANGSNPIPIVVPCHRVIGAGGSLTGYGGGLPLKRYLLDLESGATRLKL